MRSAAHYRWGKTSIDLYRFLKSEFLYVNIPPIPLAIFSQMSPLENMLYEGIVSDVRRRDGLAEVTVEDLDTTIVFCRTHLDVQDEFQRVRTGVRVRIEIGFNNFISKLKPPRPTRVVLLSDPNDPEHAELRPALRRSSSFSKGGSRRCEADGELFRPRSLSQGRRFCDEPLSVPPRCNPYEACHPNHTLPLWSRPNSPMNPPPPFYQMPPCAQYPMMPPAAGWMPPLPYFGLPPGPSRGLRPPPGLFQSSFGGMLQPSPTMPPLQRLHSHASQHPHPYVHPQNPKPMPESNSRPDFRSCPDSDMPHEDGFSELPPETMDESQVLLEITVDELRRLMLERHPTAHFPQP